jgi:DNA gyrase subunit A
MATARGQIGAVTSAGRLIRVDVLDLPALPPSAAPPSLAGGAPMSEFVTLEKDETVVGLASLEVGGLTLGTEQGVVKRVAPDYPKNADEFEVIGLKDGDRVVRALHLESEDHDLVFISSDAQLLRFSASTVRPQGRAAGGMAGIRLGAKAVWFGAFDGSLDARVVTIAGSSTTLPGTQTGAIKVADYADYPPKGRATGGVRAHRFLKGEDVLLLGWAGPAPVKASGMTGKPIELTVELGRRDGSGEKLPAPIAAVGGPVGDLTGPLPDNATTVAEDAEQDE